MEYQSFVQGGAGLHYEVAHLPLPYRSSPDIYPVIPSPDK
jgi:hypothetical protein